MEFADCGTLYNYVRLNGPMPEVQARRYFTQLISALDYLHATGFVPHRDLRPENILLDRFNNIRLIDFGLQFNVSGRHSVVGPCLAPEVAAGGKYIYSSDLWSAGVILYFLITGDFPFCEEGDALIQSITEKDLVFDAGLSPPLVDLLKKLLQKSRETRITIPRVTEHPWFSVNLYRAIKTLYASPTVDMDILAKLAKMGYDPKALPALIARDPRSNEAIMYNFLKRESLAQAADALLRAVEDSVTAHGHRLSNESRATQLAVPPRQRRSSRPLVIPPPISPAPLAAHLPSSGMRSSTVVFSHQVISRPRAVRETVSGSWVDP
jgi:serine/threonine protein kinase